MPCACSCTAWFVETGRIGALGITAQGQLLCACCKLPIILAVCCVSGILAHGSKA